MKMTGQMTGHDMNLQWKGRKGRVVGRRRQKKRGRGGSGNEGIERKGRLVRGGCRGGGGKREK